MFIYQNFCTTYGLQASQYVGLSRVFPSARVRVSRYSQATQTNVSALDDWVGEPQSLQGRPATYPLLPNPGQLQIGQRFTILSASLRASSLKQSIRVGLRCARMSFDKATIPSADWRASVAIALLRTFRLRMSLIIGPEFSGLLGRAIKPCVEK